MLKSNASIRIIAGQLRRRRLLIAPIAELRPTPNRVRESLFNWLAHELFGKTVLDLFAGTGALAFEALSRGARRATLVENNHIACKFLAQNSAHLLLEHAVNIVQSDAFCYLNTMPTEPFDVVFIDPPFAQDFYAPTLQALARKHFIDKRSKIYLESDRLISPAELPIALKVLKQKCASHVHYGLFALQ